MVNQPRNLGSGAYARNCGGSGQETNLSSAIGHYRRYMREFVGDGPYVCSYTDCRSAGTDGGHVLLQDKHQRTIPGVFLVPLCHTHNSHNRHSYYACKAEYALKIYN